MEHAVHAEHLASHDDMPFSPEEIQALHVADKQAATYVVGLMIAIFLMGVFLYSIIALTL